MPQSDRPPLISLDLETTGLDERVHETWEVGLVHEDGREWLFEFAPRRLGEASLEALRINGYVDRATLEPMNPSPAWETDATSGPGWVKGSAVAHSPSQKPLNTAVACAATIAQITNGAQLMGCAIQFDMRFLAATLRRDAVNPRWHHRALDLGSFAAGRLGVPRPLSSQAMVEQVLPNDEPHTALGDARWNMAVYERLQRAGLGRQLPPTPPLRV